MAVVINMDMPQSCDHCRLVDYPWCYVMNSDDIECTCGMRPINCPLIELTDGLWQVQGEKIWKYQGKEK